MSQESKTSCTFFSPHAFKKSLCATCFLNISEHSIQHVTSSDSTLVPAHQVGKLHTNIFEVFTAIPSTSSPSVTLSNCSKKIAPQRIERFLTASSGRSTSLPFSPSKTHHVDNFLTYFANFRYSLWSSNLLLPSCNDLYFLDGSIEFSSDEIPRWILDVKIFPLFDQNHLRLGYPLKFRLQVFNNGLLALPVACVHFSALSYFEPHSISLPHELGPHSNHESTFSLKPYSDSCLADFPSSLIFELKIENLTLLKGELRLGTEFLLYEALPDNFSGDWFANILIVGDTRTGKSSLLNSLLSCISTSPEPVAYFPVFESTEPVTTELQYIIAQDHIPSSRCFPLVFWDSWGIDLQSSFDALQALLDGSLPPGFNIQDWPPITTTPHSQQQIHAVGFTLSCEAVTSRTVSERLRNQLLFIRSKKLDPVLIITKIDKFPHLDLEQIKCEVIERFAEISPKDIFFLQSYTSETTREMKIDRASRLILSELIKRCDEFHNISQICSGNFRSYPPLVSMIRARMVDLLDGKCKSSHVLQLQKRHNGRNSRLSLWNWQCVVCSSKASELTDSYRCTICNAVLCRSCGEITTLLDYLGHPSCSKNHSLRFSMSHLTDWKCFLCNVQRSSLSYNLVCSTCEVILCFPCYFQQILQPTVNSYCPSKHPLQISYPPESWCCCACSSRFPPDIPRFICSQADWIACLSCMRYHFNPTQLSCPNGHPYIFTNQPVSFTCSSCRKACDGSLSWDCLEDACEWKSCLDCVQQHFSEHIAKLSH